jgi:transcription-repair coupling factor (superfamily II helicase)
MAAVEQLADAEALVHELRDRFGPPPPAAESLLFSVRVRALAKRAGVTSVQQAEGQLVIHGADGAPPRELLRDLKLRGLWTGPTQARLDLSAIGEAWQDALVEVLTKLARPAAIPGAGD